MTSKQPPKVNVDGQNSYNHFNVIGAKKHPKKGEPDLESPKSLCRIDLAHLFEEEELSLLVAALCASELMSHPLTRTRLQSTVARLLNQCSPHLHDHLSNLTKSCRYESLNEKPTKISQEGLTNILYALGQRKQIRLRISNISVENESIQTEVAPYYFVVSSNKWYIVGSSSWH